MASKPAPDLHIPESNTTVTISLIDSTFFANAATTKLMFNPEIKGWDWHVFGTWVTLIEHPSGRKLLYDLGCRKDWQNLPPSLGLQALVDNGTVAELSINKDVAEILKSGGMKLEDIEGIVWSHWHFDHTGDPSTFPTQTKLIVGESFKENLLPGYPSDANGRVLESDFKDRELVELDFSKTNIQIGRFKAIDWFGDGSFYILDSPGHAYGHINALARTHPSPSAAFIHLGGDSIHHPGEIRPTDYMPLPDTIDPSPAQRFSAACPGHFFTPVLRNGSRTEHILEFQDPFSAEGGGFGLIVDEPALRDTVRKDEELDANDNVFTIIAHDWSLKGILDEWPKNLNNWRESGWKEKTRWKFLEDFEGACGDE